MLDSVLIIIIIFAIFYYILLIKKESNDKLKQINNKIDNISYFSYPYDFVEYYLPYFDPFYYFGRSSGYNATLRYPYKNRYHKRDNHKRGNKPSNNDRNEHINYGSKGLRR